MSEFNFKPLRDFIITDLPKVQETTDAGIILPEHVAKSRTKIANPVVLAAGPDAGCKAGDTVVIYPEATYTIINIYDKDYALFTQYGIVGIL
jgi:co-chaperonin GroES (HSP10)